MKTVVRPELVRDKSRNGAQVAALKFQENEHELGIILMNYGFPGDVRNYDIASELATLGYTTYIPHPLGIEESDGDFSFAAAPESLATFYERLYSNPKFSGVVCYCYSTLWTLQVLVSWCRPCRVLMLSPVFDWSRIRATISQCVVGGFQEFLTQAQHGHRQGFYGVRANPDELMLEHLSLEPRMTIGSIVQKSISLDCKIVYGSTDVLMDAEEINHGARLLIAAGARVSIVEIPGANHFFLLRRSRLLEEFRRWLI